jgi:tetratricopeptide (TPR) repeat protein
MSEIRKALGDSAKNPRYVETVHRRGYRFIAPVKNQLVQRSEPQVPGQRSELIESFPPTFVGRDAELELLQKWFGKAANGERQIVFVTGEPGIGKTTTVETLLRHCAADRETLIGRGQCIEHYGVGEPYLPILEALGRLCRGPEGEWLIQILGQYAPTWLVQMSALVGPEAFETLRRKVAGATQRRMLRELTEAVEVIAAQKRLVLCLEDLHWCDYSTLDWLAFLGRRREPARLLVLGTYRPVEVILHDHALRSVKQELQIHGQCRELTLGLLGESAVAEYLTERFESVAIPQAMIGATPSGAPQTFARAIHSRTEGNPFFVKSLVDPLIAQEVIVRVDQRWKLQGDLRLVGAGTPEGPKQMVLQQLDRVHTADRGVFDAASVAGVEFSVAVVAAALEKSIGEIEERCETFVRAEQFLYARGVDEWPDKTVAARYGFIHGLYREVIYDRIPAARRTELHRKIAEREEQAYGTRAPEIAAELAVHFERGRDHNRAAQYRRSAGQNAVRRSADREALSHFVKGLEILGALPDTVERSRAELTLLLSLGPVLIATKGSASNEVERSYKRARRLCEQLDDAKQLFPVLFGLRSLSLARSDLPKAHEFGEQLLELAVRQEDSDLVLEAHLALGNTWFQLGEPSLAREHLEQGIALYEPAAHGAHAFIYGVEPGMFCYSFLAVALQLLGYPEQAQQNNRDARVLTQELSHPYSLATASNFAAWFHELCGEAQSTQQAAETAIALCDAHGFPASRILGTIRQGWSLVEQGAGEEAIAQIRDGLNTWEDIGARLGRPYFLALLADAYRKLGQIELGLEAVAEALNDVKNCGERWIEADLYRLKGELTLQSQTANQRSKVEEEAETCFHKALAIARQQQAKFWELRTATSLAQLWRKQGKQIKAHALLSEIYDWFTEGFEAKVLQDAKALLEKLA